MRTRRSDEQGGKGSAEQAPASECERRASHSRADEIAALYRGRANTRHPETQLGSQTKAARAAHEGPAPGDEAQRREEPDTHPYRRPQSSEQCNGDRRGQCEANEQATAVLVDPASKEEVPRHVHQSAESERKSRH